MSSHTIKILGKNCGSCQWTERLVRDTIAERGLGPDVVVLEKVTSTSVMIGYGVMSTPAVVIDERVVHVGGIPKKGDVEHWLSALTA